MPMSWSVGATIGARPIDMFQSIRVGISKIRKIFPETWMFDSFDFNDT